MSIKKKKNIRSKSKKLAKKPNFRVVQGRKRPVRETVKISGGTPVIVNEIASAISPDMHRYEDFMSVQFDPNPIHRNPKFSGRALFEDMDTDPRIYTTMRARKDALKRRPSVIRPSDNTFEQAVYSAFVIYNLKQIGELGDKKKQIKRDLDFGYSITEKILEYRDVHLDVLFDKVTHSVDLKNCVVVKDLKSKNVNAFSFDDKGNVFMRNKNAEFQSELIKLKPEQESHFIISTFDRRNNSRYGWPVKVSMFPCYLMKKAAKLWRLMFVERYGMPIPHGKYRPGTPKTGTGSQEEFKKRLAGLQHAAYIMTPEGFTVEFLDAMKFSSSFDIYQSMLDYCDAEIAEVGLGHREAVSQSGTGNYAADVMKSVALRQEILETDGIDLDNAFFHQFIVPLINWNWPNVMLYPKMFTNTDATRDLNATITQFQTGNSMGVDLDLDQVYENMGWRRPTVAENTLPGNVSATFNDRSRIKEKLAKMHKELMDLRTIVNKLASAA